jgi:hypothetical protein
MEMFALLTGPFGKFLFFAGLFAVLIPIMADRSRHRPGNVAPIQLISAIGACALLLLQEALLVAAVRDGSPIVACASFATLLTTMILFLRGDGAAVVKGQAPQTIDAMVAQIQQILGRASRTGIETVTAVIIDGPVPFVGVSVPRRGHIVVRVRKDLLPWLEWHGRHGVGDAAAGSLVRFMFLHELGHVLNGDHLTYRFARSVLVAHLWWLAAAVAACAMPPAGGSAAHDTLMTSLCLVPPFLAQRFLGRRFLAEREEDADMRALQTLDPGDASSLTKRKTPSGPTELEKLMASLIAQTPPRRSALGLLSIAIRWIWPEGGRISERSDLLTGVRGGRSARPIWWAACMGMQCGLLSIAILAAFGTALEFALIVMALTCSMAATYCGMRADPALVRLHDLKKMPLRRIVGAIFYLALSASTLLLYLLPAFAGALPYRLFTLVVVVSAPQVILGSLMAAAVGARGPDDAARTLRHLILRPGPAIVIAAAVNIGCSLFAAWCFGVAWQGPAVATFAGVIVTIVSSRSTNPGVRSIAPIAMLDSPGNIYAIRIFWREFYFDRGTMSDLRVGIIGVATYIAIAEFFAFGAAFAARMIALVAGDEVVFLSLLLMSGAIVFVLERFVPKRVDTTAHLPNIEHLQMFEHLLTAARIAELEDGKLKAALALWVGSDPDLPHAVLPEPRSIWKLETLLPLIRIAKAVGEEEILSRWRRPIVDALGQIVRNGEVTANGSLPSFGYSVLAAQVIDETGLTEALRMDALLDSIAGQLEQWLKGEIAGSVDSSASAWWLLAKYGRPRPGPDYLRQQSLSALEFMLTRPIQRKSVGEFVAYTKLLEDTRLHDHLASIVRSRLWDTLILNPDNDVPLLLDCYLAAVSLGETDSSLLATAKPKIGFIVDQLADELTAYLSSDKEGGRDIPTWFNSANR